MDTAYLHLLLSIAKRYLETLWSAATAETLFSIFRGPIHSLDELEAFAGALLRFLIRGGDDGDAAAGAQGGLLGLCAELAVAGVDDDEQSWAAEPARVNDAESRWEDDRTACVLRQHQGASPVAAAPGIALLRQTGRGGRGPFRIGVMLVRG